MKSLISYSITEPPSEEDQLRAFKYPFASSEILSISNSSILDLFFSIDEKDKGEEQEDKAIVKQEVNTDIAPPNNETVQILDEKKDIVAQIIDQGKAVSSKQSTCSSEGSENLSKYELLDYLFSFVAVPQLNELNETLAGYFKKIALALLNGKTKEIAEYFESNEPVLHNLFLHADNRSVSEILCKIMAIEDLYITNPLRFNQLRSNVIQGLLSVEKIN